MAEIVYEDVTPIIANTTMQKRYVDGVFKTYWIRPVDGYVLHDTNYDQPIMDKDTFEQIGLMIGYHTNVVTCATTYQFTPTEMLDEAGDTVTAYGARQFFCKLATDVPADQIFGNVNLPETN